MKLSVIFSFLPIASVLSAPIILSRGHGKRLEHSDITPMLDESPKIGIVEAAPRQDGAVGALLGPDGRDKIPVKDASDTVASILNSQSHRRDESPTSSLLNNIAGKDGISEDVLRKVDVFSPALNGKETTEFPDTTAQHAPRSKSILTFQSVDVAPTATCNTF